MTNIASNSARAFGYKVGSASNLVLHYLRSVPHLSLGCDQIAETLGIKRSMVDTALYNGVLCNSFTKEKSGRKVTFRFHKLPELKASTFVSSTGATIERKNIGKQAASLEQTHRNNLANPPKPKGDNTPVPHESARYLTVAEGYPPYKHWVDPGSVPMFRYGSGVAA